MTMPMSQPHAPPHYLSYWPQHPHHHYYYHPMPHHHAPPPSQPLDDGIGGPSDNLSIWGGDLEEWRDENYLWNCFDNTGEVSSVKVIRNRLTGHHGGYGFVEFVSHGAAERALQLYSRTLKPYTNRPFRLKWATGDNKFPNNNGDSKSYDHSIFVGDLASDVTDSLLHETFSGKYPSVKGAKVVINTNTGRPKGYGFVRFGDETEMSRAMTEMEGTYCSTRTMRIVTRRKSLAKRGLDPEISGEDLKQPFAQYGEILSVKIPQGKGCGFVQFANRNDAENALQQLNGTTIGRRAVRLAWGHGNKQSNEKLFGHGWTGAYYYGGPYHDGFGYPIHRLHDPNPAYYGPYIFYGSVQQEGN